MPAPGLPLERRGRPFPAAFRTSRRAACAGLAVSACASLVVTIAAVRQQVEDQEVAARAAAARLDPDAGRPLDVLVIGTDDRHRTGAHERGPGRRHGDHSATTMIVHVAADRGRVDVVTLPREAMLVMPACDRGDAAPVPARYAPMGSAFDAGGPACTRRAVEDATGITVEHVLVVDFEDFADVVDAMGGVDVCLDRRVRDPHLGVDLPPGCRRMDGTEALGFVRAGGHGGGSGEASRVRNRHDFLSAAVHQASAERLSMRPDRLARVVEAVSRSIGLDRDVTGAEALARLAMSLRDVPASRVTFTTVPCRSADRDPAHLVWADGATALFDAIAEDRPLPPRVAAAGG